MTILSYTYHYNTSVRKICNFTINKDHSNKKIEKQGQSPTPADILVDNLIPNSLTNFSLHLFVYFFATIIILVNSQVSLQMKE